jgi:hypothetical protein
VEGYRLRSMDASSNDQHPGEPSNSWRRAARQQRKRERRPAYAKLVRILLQAIARVNLTVLLQPLDLRR